MTKKRSVLLGCLAGGVGGAVGTFVLNLFQELSLEATRRIEGVLSENYTYTTQQRKLLEIFEIAHVATAESLGISIRPADRQKTATAVEFAFGVICGALYGALAEYKSEATAGSGSAYGAVLFTGASEIVLPAIGFVPSPADRTLIQHVGGLSGNVVYGVTTEAVRHLLRAG